MYFYNKMVVETIMC